MIRVTALKLPIFSVKMDVPDTTIILKTPTKRDYYELIQGNTDAAEPYLLTTMPPLTDTTREEFIKHFAEETNSYREANMDYLGAPEKEDFGQDKKEHVKLPILTSAENLVYEHSGLNFIDQLELPIIEFWLLLSDAIKQRILQRSDGVEYLNECYQSMHKISTLTPKIRK